MTIINATTITANTLNVGVINPSSWTNNRIITLSTPANHTWGTGTNLQTYMSWMSVWTKQTPRCSGCGRWAKVVDTSKMSSPVDCKRCMGEMPRRH